MKHIFRPRRSMLYMPSSNTRALEKSRSLKADCYIFDLEDSVAPDSKATARENIKKAVAEGGYGSREIIVRTNGLHTAWGYEDIAVLATSGVNGILLPKVSSADTMRMAESILVANGAPPEMTLWAMIETPMGVLHAERIALSTPRLAGFVMGTSDLVQDVFALHTYDRVPMLYSLSHCIIVARAHNLSILDGVHLDLHDDEGFERTCMQGRELGFDGRTLIHPKTIDMANAIYSPHAHEVQEAEETINAFEEAHARGEYLVVRNGKLIENLHVVAAHRILNMARAIESLE